jgi:hypothetical protein
MLLGGSTTHRQINGRISSEDVEQNKGYVSLLMVLP